MRILLFLLLLTCWNCDNDVKTKKMIKASEGEFSKTNKRIGEWKYYNDEGDLVASGKYTDGLKEGIWKYSQKTYNNSNNIDWVIFSNYLFKINLPKDWELTTDTNQSVPLTFLYNDSIRPNGNITLIKRDSLLSLSEASHKLIEQNKVGDSHKILIQKEVEINGLNSIYSQQVISLNEEEIFIEQYLIEGIKEDYLVSFFVKGKYISRYHQLFTEIAYSFTDN